MKFILAFLFLCGYSFSNAQTLDQYAQTKTLTDQNGKAIGKMTMIPGLRADLALKACTQSKDSSGYHRTEYSFIMPNHLEATNVTLILQFDRQFYDVMFDTEGEADNVRTTIADNKVGTSFQTSRLAPDGVIKITVISKKRGFVTITGISGQLNQK